jgi:hypothetical protein
VDEKSFKELLATVVDDLHRASVSASLGLLLAANPQLDRAEARDQIQRQEHDHFAALRARLNDLFPCE